VESTEDDQRRTQGKATGKDVVDALYDWLNNDEMLNAALSEGSSFVLCT